MPKSEKLMCPYCDSNNTIKNGKTSAGSPRYKCKDCAKSWSENTDTSPKPSLAELSSLYLNGASTRDLVPVYKSSPLRINQKIRGFLDNCPDWEDYVDEKVEVRHSRIVYLIGKRFNCYNKETSCSTMYVAMAYDAYSSMVLGYEICNCGCDDVWDKLITRMSERGIEADNFMTSQPHVITDVVNKHYPKAKILSNILRTLRHEELSCCLKNVPIKYKFINDADNLYQNFRNRTLKDYIKEYSNTTLRGFLSSHHNAFVTAVHKKCRDKSNFRIEDLHKTFSRRFERFHTLKNDPKPLVNGWIALHMTASTNTDFSRLSYYMQKPVLVDLESFSNNEDPKTVIAEEPNAAVDEFLLESSTRILQLPLTETRCELKVELCADANQTDNIRKLKIQI
jgi:hypothetical protein